MTRVGDLAPALCDGRILPTSCSGLALISRFKHKDKHKDHLPNNKVKTQRRKDKEKDNIPNNKDIKVLTTSCNRPNIVGQNLKECIPRFPILETEFKVFSVHGERSTK